MNPSNNPTVCAIMLVDGRFKMCHRAIRAFLAQTYRPCKLFVFETVRDVFSTLNMDGYPAFVGHGSYLDPPLDITIGALRNHANAVPCAEADIIVHWDSDDTSHPRRIEEQVALLQASGKQCVGYRDMLFWRTFKSRVMCDSFGGNGPEGRVIVDREEAWLYSNNDPRYALGTSLCYWRSAWEARPFPDAPKPGGSGEDKLWLDEIDSRGFTSLHSITVKGEMYREGEWLPGGVQLPPTEPRMIASIHGGNTSTQYADLGRVESNNWRRAPEWDAHCRERMKL